MKKILLILMSLFILTSCQNDKEEEKITSLDNSVFGIEQITINDSTYSLKPNSLLIDKGSNSPLVLIGSSYSSNSVGLDYAWMSLTEKTNISKHHQHKRDCQRCPNGNRHNENDYFNGQDHLS